MHRFVVFIFLFSRQFSCGLDLVWSDEFNDDGQPNPDHWEHDIGDWGWGNGEFQNYTTDNSYVRDGSLFIECRRKGDSFTSARLKTDTKLFVLYGTIEARIRVPNVANGLWPAFWTLGQEFRNVSWPFAGEIDIMEIGKADGIVDGVVNRRILSSVHYEHNGHIHESGTIDAPFLFHQDFHLYRMEWTPEHATFYVDDILIYQADITNGCGGNCTELHKPHFLILNLAVGGGYTYVPGEPWGPERITATFPAIMQVDYVRVYDNGFTKVTGPAVAPTTPPSFDQSTDETQESQPSQPPVSKTPTQAPAASNPSQPPFISIVSSDSALCSAHNGCGSLQGDCCPTSTGSYLACCDNNDLATGRVVEKSSSSRCLLNPQCDRLGLQGDCCPTTSNNMYLDCCDLIPEDTSCPGQKCVVYSAQLYASELSTARSGSVMARTTFSFAAIVLMVVMCTTIP